MKPFLRTLAGFCVLFACFCVLFADVSVVLVSCIFTHYMLHIESSENE